MYENIIKELDKLKDLVELALEITLKEDKVYKPTVGMASAARRALKWHEEGHPGYWSEPSLLSLVPGSRRLADGHWTAGRTASCQRV